MLGAKDYQSVPYSKKDVEQLRLDKMRPQVLQHVMTSNEWTRAVLIREPSERLLSAYLDKVRKHQPKQSNVVDKEGFTQFVNKLSSKNWWKTDPHWRPQAYTCGMGHNLQHIDYIGGLDRADYHSKQILQQVGLWDSHGRYYQTSPSHNHTRPRAVRPPENPVRDPPGFQQHDHTDHHSRGSIDLVEHYYTKQTLEKVKKLYWMDYALWNVLQTTNATRGIDVARILNTQCDTNADISIA